MLSLPIETIIFDLDGTLRHSIPSADDTQFRIASQLGAVTDPNLQKLGARWAHYYWAQSTELLADMDRFGDHDGEFWINYGYRYLRSLTVPKELAVELAPRSVALMEAEYNPENHVYPCVPETLGTLKEAGFTLGLVSNRSNPCQEECEELGLLGYFEFAYVAAEVDAWKPDPRIFDQALELTASAPERTVYVGDNYYADILGAQKAGLQPILLDEKGVFPDVECVVIERLEELVELMIED
jgi:HAD superfamily hydrolase (TIGR01549 family)